MTKEIPVFISRILVGLMWLAVGYLIVYFIHISFVENSERKRVELFKTTYKECLIRRAKEFTSPYDNISTVGISAGLLRSACREETEQKTGLSADKYRYDVED